MSRHTITVDAEKCLVIGWDNPLQSYFWQVYNRKDEARIRTLESQFALEANEYAELDALYAKYANYGGEPIIADSGLGGPNRISDVVELQKQVKEYALLPSLLSQTLIGEKLLAESGR